MEVKVNDLVFIGRRGDRATRSFKHFFSARWESMFGPGPLSSSAHWTTIPSHWAWESGLCKSRQSGLKYSQAQKQARANTVGWKTRSLEMNAQLFFPVQPRRKKRTEWQEMLL